MNHELCSEQPELLQTEAPQIINRSQLIVDHRDIGIRLAKRILGRWQMRLCFDELTSLVDLSLCEAANQFKEDRGAQFSTFLFYYIRGNVVQYIEKSVAAKALTTKLTADDCLNGETVDTPEQSFLRIEGRKTLEQLCASLAPMEREVITQRFLKETSRKQVAANLGIPLATVRSLERHALFTLRNAAKRTLNSDGPAAANAETPNLSEPPKRRRRRARMFRERIHAELRYRPVSFAA